MSLQGSMAEVFGKAEMECRDCSFTRLIAKLRSRSRQSPLGMVVEGYSSDAKLRRNRDSSCSYGLRFFWTPRCSTVMQIQHGGQSSFRICSKHTAKTSSGRMHTVSSWSSPSNTPSRSGSLSPQDGQCKCGRGNLEELLRILLPWQISPGRDRSNERRSALGETLLGQDVSCPVSV